MEQRRFILFLTLSMAVLFGWINIGPVLFPGMFPKPPQKQQQLERAEAGKDQPAADPAAPAPKPLGKDDGALAAKEGGDGENAAPADPQPAGGDAPEKAAEKPKLPRHPHRTVKLGSVDPETGYFMEVELTSRGAAVVQNRLSDPRYRELTRRDAPLKVIGNAASKHRTLDLSVAQVDEQLKAFGASLADLSWELVETTPDPQLAKLTTAAVFRMVSPDGKLELRKRYQLQRVDKKESQLVEARDTDSAGYQLHFDLTVKNLSDQNQSLVYALQGPVGVPLENIENTRKFRDLQMGFLNDDGSVDSSTMSAAKVFAAEEEGNLEEWKRPLRYIGVDVQYFAAILVPGEDQQKAPYIAVAKPMVIERQRDKTHSDVSVQLTSHPISLDAGEEVTHEYTLFAGPKRQALLAGFDAEPILDYGMFGFVAKAMLGLLTFLHGAGIPYGIAIICLTIIVRGCMFPLSKKQAVSAKKMKELQPKIQELRKKYEKDKEKLARAQMELFSKNNYNPFAGCLPIFLQLPIFIGLYTALNAAVDLRMASFLWIDNLAAPDALVMLPFQLPFLGTAFNLLPIVTIALFIAQQKMFMPPPTDDQQAMQYKMMNYMMVFMGFLFYHVPAGLCIYFIASSLWGMGERKMLDFGASAPPTPDADGDGKSPEKKSRDEKVVAVPARRSAMSMLSDLAAMSDMKPNATNDAKRAKKKSRRR